MLEEGIWVYHPETDEPMLLSYDDVPEEANWQIFQPLGGFIYPIDQFVRLDLAKVPYYIKDWLPKRGRCVVYAPAKAGKSFLSLEIAYCIGSKEPFLGIPVNQGRVLLVQFELGAEILQARIQATQRSYPNVFVGTTFALKLDTEAGTNALERAMAAVSPDVLILDPLYKMLSGDENDAQVFRKATDNLDKLLSAFNCSLFLFHHPGKDISKGGRGSSVLEDWVDSYLEMRKTSSAGEPLQVRITPKMLRHAELPPTSIAAQMDSMYHFHVLQAEPRVVDLVEQYLVSRHPAPVKRAEILNAGIGSNTSVQEALNDLVGLRKAERVARGEYKILKEE